MNNVVFSTNELDRIVSYLLRDLSPKLRSRLGFENAKPRRSGVVIETKIDEKANGEGHPDLGYSLPSCLRKNDQSCGGEGVEIRVDEEDAENTKIDYMIRFFLNLENMFTKSDVEEEELNDLFYTASVFGKRLSKEILKNPEMVHGGSSGTDIAEQGMGKGEMLNEITELNKACLLMKMRNEELEKCQRRLKQELQTLKDQEEKKTKMTAELQAMIDDMKKEKRKFYKKTEDEHTANTNACEGLSKNIKSLQETIIEMERQKQTLRMQNELGKDMAEYRQSQSVQMKEEKIVELDKQAKVLQDNLLKQKKIIFIYAKSQIRSSVLQRLVRSVVGWFKRRNMTRTILNH